jgi:hypothetical protein
MEIARGIGPSARVAVYTVPDNELAVGSTLGGPKVCMVIKATGAIEKVYSIDTGETLFGALVLHHWDERTGMNLAPLHAGTFTIHPEHQEHQFTLANGVVVHEDLFVLSGRPGQDGSVDPPAVYYAVELRNDADEEARVATYAFCELRGQTSHDVVTTYDKRENALVAWNASNPDRARIFGCSEAPASYETTLDYAKAVLGTCPGALSGATDAPPSNPLGVLHLSHSLKPGESTRFYYLLSFSDDGRRGATTTYRACLDADAALARTLAYYHEVLGRSIVLTPNPQVNRGVLWAKANMLRVEAKAPTGWCFVNDPTRSNNSVGRDTAWFAMGADYLTPDFARESLRAYVRLQEKSGKIIEYYDIRTDKTADYGLNINDNTPLLILALWHHYNATGDEDFLREVYPAAVKAARYILSQRNDQGLVWCTATGTSDWGIVGWRNVIKDYRLSGATTEVNSECYAALQTVSHMARVMGEHDVSAQFAEEAAALKEAINAHLYNPENGLYYLNIDLDGQPRSDVTSDLVFPVMFGVAPPDTAAHIIGRLSSRDFWTDCGMRTTPRDAPNYSPGPEPAYGLMGGVWVGVAFWYAFAAAPYNPEFMDYALGASFQSYSRDPRQNNTVPGQFSEWLHGETLVNQGMMLSPWFPPRYLWAAIEGAAGLDLAAGAARVHPRLAADWKWMGVQNLPYRGQRLTWLAVRTPDIQMYTTSHFQESPPYRTYEEDITPRVHATGDAAVALGLRQGENLLLFAGNTDERTISTALRVEGAVSGSYRSRVYNSLVGRWTVEDDLVPAERLTRGIAMQLERKGFWVLDLTQEV